MKTLAVRHLAKSYGNIQAVVDFSLDVPAGVFVTLLGPSGSGKSTVLRLIAGFETPDRGQVALDGRDVTSLPPHQRPSAMVFQRYALFPHMTVRQNIAFGLNQQRLAASVVAQRVETMLDLVHLSGRADHHPHQLSGGQEQRVALARSLALEPRLLLLDEPLAALDAGLRKQMQGELKEIQRQTGITFLAVTHDQEEALTLSDQVVVMHDGRIMQVGTPADIFERPRNRFVANFMGAENILPAMVLNRSAHATTVEVGGLVLTLPVTFDAPGDRAGLVIRPEAFRLDAATASGWPGQVVDVTYKGSTRLLTVVLDEAEVAERRPHGAAHTGEEGETNQASQDETRLKVSVPAGTTVTERVVVSFLPEQAVLIPDDGVPVIHSPAM
jgi:spermidine/putrescine ABC transporter ATP-binding subunit